MNYSVAELGDICDEIYRYPSFYGMEHFSTGVPVIRGEHIDAWGNVSQDWNDYWFVSEEVSNRFPRTVLREGDLVFTVRGTIGKVGLITKSHDGAQLSPNLIRFSPKREVVDTIFLWYFLQSIKETAAADIQNEVTIASVRASDLSELKIPLPPLSEQKRIASLLARADRLRQLRRTAHDLGDALLQSVFLEMFGDVAHSKWDKSELGELIEGFEAGVNYLPGSEGEKTSEWRVLKISAVTWGDFDPMESKAIREYGEFDETHIVRQGDLLISRANTTELVGAVSLVKIIPPKVLLPDKLWRVKFREDSTILPEYTLHVLRQLELRKIIGDLATGSSGSMKNISMEKAATLPIPVPPLSLQEEFAGMVARVEGLRGRISETERQVDGLFESLLAESFS